MKPVFYEILANSLVASLTNTLVWFGVTFWVYLQTQSVLATSVMAGIYLVTVAVSGFFLGSLVDRYRKKTALLISNVGSLVLYALAYLIYVATPAAVFADASSAILWGFIIVALVGAIAGNLRTDDFPIYHVCFRVTEAEFDAILERIKASGTAYRSTLRGSVDRQFSTQFGGRMIYWNEPDGHQWELLTVSYARPSFYP